MNSSSSSPNPASDNAASSTGQESIGANAAAAARVEREEALRILLAIPDDEAPRASKARPIPKIDVSFQSADDISLPVVPSAARTAAVPLTVVEAGLGLLVVILACTLAILAGSEFRSRARAARCATELRTLAGALENYHREKGKWPAAAPTRGAVPPGMETSFSADTWSRLTPLGGHYAWVKRAGKNPPALAITAFVPDTPLALSRDELRRIDRLLDDGDLATGRFRTGFNGWPVYFLAGEN